jgi:hypothetical protein
MPKKRQSQSHLIAFNLNALSLIPLKEKQKNNRRRSRGVIFFLKKSQAYSPLKSIA